MKKYVIPIVAFLLCFVLIFSYAVFSAIRKQTYFRHASYHYSYASMVAEKPVGVGADGTEVHCNLHNTRHFLNAVTRTEVWVLIFPPKVSGMESTELVLPNGAEYTVWDAGEKDGEDVVYIRYMYHDKTMFFSLKGYKTFTRVSTCVSPEGYNSENRIVG